MSIGGIQAPIPTPQSQGITQVQQRQETQRTEQPKATKETFANVKSQVSLPVTSKNAMTQLSSADQKLILKTDVLPKSIIGAGQSVPPASMRAMVAARGNLFTGRNFEIFVGKESSTLSFRIGGKSFNASITTKLKKSASKKQSDDELDDELEEDL